MDEVSNKEDEVICALVITPDEAALKLLEIFKPRYIFLAMGGRKLAEKAASLGEVRICTYTPWEVPPDFKTAGPLSFIEACRGRPVLVI
ncbi:hypothetical protein [Pyrobaculum ferrireducens]|uniref:Uncharacterized protein n=1 Tax=Pyrobaculum ferrireducens TaxID=1104324 RepID=G7VH28_9CREN|nr:hypothetical protein [Pyrobaculum ferrireducens]AET33199.1 hypothetical protein P186_1791 [Pyrobaculum ferrireducens]